VGGAVIVMRRVETGETYVGEVPLPLFQGDTFKRKLYLDEALGLVRKGVETLGVSKDEPIHICRGFILSKARESLREAGFIVVPFKIRGETQALAETEYIKSLVRLGVGDELKVGSMRSFNSFLRWVRGDLECRERYVKKGWSAWPRWREEGASEHRT
jgi:hypothetical protein